MVKATLKEFLEAVKYHITSGDEYIWDNYGSTARYLDYDVRDDAAGHVSASAVYNSDTQTIYEMQVWDTSAKREYRWIDPEFVEAHKAECKKRGVSHKQSLDGREFIDLDLVGDILEKITAIVEHKPYDTRVQIELDLADKDLSALMLLAHEQDITLNALIIKILEDAINSAYAEVRQNKFAKLYAQFLNENMPAKSTNNEFITASVVVGWALANDVSVDDATHFLKFVQNNT